MCVAALVTGAAIVAQTPTPAPSRIAQADAIVDAILARDFGKVITQFEEAMKAALPGDTFANAGIGRRRRWVNS
jgi:hypothetical protein